LVDDDRLLERLQDLALETGARPVGRQAFERDAADLDPGCDLVRTRVVVGVQRAPQHDEHRQEGGDDDEAPGPHPCAPDSR